MALWCWFFCFDSLNLISYETIWICCFNLKCEHTKQIGLSLQPVEVVLLELTRILGSYSDNLFVIIFLPASRRLHNTAFRSKQLPLRPVAPQRTNKAPRGAVPTVWRTSATGDAWTQSYQTCLEHTAFECQLQTAYPEIFFWFLSALPENSGIAS